MNKIRQILRLHNEAHLSQRQIAKSLGISHGAVNKYITNAAVKGISWPLPDDLADENVLQEFFNASEQKAPEPKHSTDFPKIHKELKRKGVTLQLLWEEAREMEASIVSYPQYCWLYRKWKKTLPRSMRQTHKAGDKVFVDYAGQTVHIIDKTTGEVKKAQIFVGVLGASNYTYVEATWSQQLSDWLGSHRRMFEFFGGVPYLIVPDNLRSGVNKACRYEPEINQTYMDFIEHYNTAVLPARPIKPKDKAKVECGVLIIERWILARLRNETFYSLAELNSAIRRLVTIANNKHFQKDTGSRLSAFNEIDRPALKPLPTYPYEYVAVKKVKVGIDYHVELERHYYSVPHNLIGKEIILRYTNTSVECWLNSAQVAIHIRSYQPRKHTTVTEHMPKAHQAFAAWTPARFLNWAGSIGQDVLLLVQYLLENKPHPEQGYRSCLGLLGLAKKYGNIRLNQACYYAWQLGAKTRRSVASILERKLDLVAPNANPAPALAIEHNNIRGKQHYQ